MTKLLYWQVEYKDKLAKMSNEELLDEVIDETKDAYAEGCGKRDYWMHVHSLYELEDRLKLIGFLHD